MEYQVNVAQAGKYTLAATVVTVNYDQRINVSVNDSEETTTVNLPFTNGEWSESDAVTLTLKQGENKLKFFRDAPPQYGVSVKSFSLTPVK